MLANSFSDSYVSIGAFTACFVVARIIVLCTVLFLCVCVMFIHLPMSFEISMRSLRIWPLRQSVQERRYHEIMSLWIALFGGPALSSSAQGLLSQISLKYKTVRANPNTGRVFHACHRMISASAVVLGFGLQEHLEDTSWPFNSSLQAVPSVCKMIQIYNY